MTTLTLKPLLIDPTFKGKTTLSSGNSDVPGLVVLGDGDLQGQVQLGNSYSYRIAGGKDYKGIKFYENDIEVLVLDDSGITITGAIKCTDLDNSPFAVKESVSSITANPTTTTAYGLTGSVTQFFSWVLKRLEEGLGYAWGVAIPFSLKALAEQADIGTLYIPAGGTFSPITRAGRNRTYNKIFIDCHGENPTSLVITIFHNGSLIYTSPAITVNETIIPVNLTITGEQTVQAFTSNTTGLTKGISVSLKQVNRK